MKQPDALGSRRYVQATNTAPGTRTLNYSFYFPFQLPGEDLDRIRARLWAPRSGDESDGDLPAWWKPNLRPESLGLHVKGLNASTCSDTEPGEPSEHPLRRLSQGDLGFEASLRQLEGALVNFPPRAPIKHRTDKVPEHVQKTGLCTLAKSRVSWENLL